MPAVQSMSETFSVTMGVTAGYDHHNENVTVGAVNFVIPIWNKYMQEIYNNTSVVVSAVFQEAKVVYPVAKGAAGLGEDVVVITGSYRDESGYTLEKWKEAVVQIADNVRLELKQTTARVCFAQCEMHYLK